MSSEFRIYMAGMIVLLIVAFTPLGGPITYIGQFLWMMGWLAWIAMGDSRKRWPHANLRQRFTNVLTFKR